MEINHKQGTTAINTSDDDLPKQSSHGRSSTEGVTGKHPIGWYGAPKSYGLIASVLAMVCTFWFQRFSANIMESLLWERIMMAVIMWLEWFLVWWFVLLGLRKLRQVRRSEIGLEDLRIRWSEAVQTNQNDQGLLPREKAPRLLDHCLVRSQRLPFGTTGKQLFSSLLHNFAKGTGHHLLERRLERASDATRYLHHQGLRQLRLIPLALGAMTSIQYIQGESPGLLSLTLLMTGFVAWGAHWLARQDTRLATRWFSFLHDDCLSLMPMIDPGIEQLTQELVMTRKWLGGSLQQLIQVHRAHGEQNQQWFLQATQWHKDNQDRHNINDRRSEAWLQSWERGQNQQRLQIEALGDILERELGAGSLQESIQSMHTVTSTFATQLERMLHQLHEKMMVGGDHLRTTAESLKIYVQQGGVADTALLHKSLNDFRQVVQELTTGFNRMEDLTVRLVDLPQAVEGMTQAGTALVQGGNMARRLVTSFADLRQQFGDLGETISQQVGRQNELQTEATAVLAKTNQVISNLQTTMNAVEQSLGETGSEIAAIQNIMERMALRSGF